MSEIKKRRAMEAPLRDLRRPELNLPFEEATPLAPLKKAL